MHLAACVEFIHTATLLHDDVVDESALRRGLASANAVFGNKASVLVGDFLFARAFQLMVADGSLRVLDILSRAAATIAEGEVLQLVTQNDLSTPESRYLDVIRGKTAALFAAACQVGAVVADGPPAQEAALADYGMNIGIAFQLVDDALDYAADQAKLGKTVGDDFREGKITLPVLVAYAAGDADERAFWAPAEVGKSAECVPPTTRRPRRRPRQWHCRRPAPIRPIGGIKQLAAGRVQFRHEGVSIPQWSRGRSHRGMGLESVWRGGKVGDSVSPVIQTLPCASSAIARA